MESDGFKFDLETQRFIVNRWETTLGKKVREDLIEGIKSNVEIRAILGSYVLEDPENKAPYSHPIYPASSMLTQDFWVLTSDDLRGIRFYSEDFSGTRSLERKSLGYSYFYGCNLIKAELACADYSYATFKKCLMNDALFVSSGGFCTTFEECDLRGAALSYSALRAPDFSGSNLSGAYFKETLLDNIIVNHQTKFDDGLQKPRGAKDIPVYQSPDILRSIRIGYKDAEIWDQMDNFLFKEQQARRRAILWPDFKARKSIRSFSTWLNSYIVSVASGYSTKPVRIIFLALVFAISFAVIYFIAGTPNGQTDLIPSIYESVYFSMTTFATLGYGDISYSACRPLMRITSTVEAWLGAITISLFVVALSRKVFR